MRSVTLCCDPSLDLLTLADCIERESRRRGPVSGLLDRFRDLLQRSEPSATAEVDGIARLRTIVDELARDVAGGHVRSISGLVAQTRCCVEPRRSATQHPAA